MCCYDVLCVVVCACVCCYDVLCVCVCVCVCVVRTIGSGRSQGLLALACGSLKKYVRRALRRCWFFTPRALSMLSARTRLASSNGRVSRVSCTCGRWIDR